MGRFLAALAASMFAFSSYARDVPVPKMLSGAQGENGRYKVEILESIRDAKEDKRRFPSMSLCSDNLMNSATERAKSRGEADCKHRLLKDTENEAVMESLCKERNSTITMKREGKSMVMDIASNGTRGERSMKMRFTHQGPCRDEPGAR